MIDVDVRIPEFAVALRGYDRLQVDGYIERLQELLEDTEERLRAVEPGDHHDEVGPRISQIFDLAAAEALDIRAAAEQEAERLLSAARLEADAIAERSRADRAATLSAYEATRDRIKAETTQLRNQKEAVLADVRRLHDALGIASGLEPLTTTSDPATREFTSEETREFTPVAADLDEPDGPPGIA